MALAPIFDQNRQPVGTAQYAVGGAPATPSAPGADPYGPTPANLFNQPGGGLVSNLMSGGGLGGGLNIRNLYQNLLRQGAGSGVFSPHYLRDVLRSAALRRQRAAQQRSGVLGRLVGLDPGQQRAALAQSGIQGQHDLSGALNDASATDAQQYHDMIMSILGQEGSAYNAAADRQAAKKAQGGGFGAFLGQVAGAAIPGVVSHFLPPASPRQPAPASGSNSRYTQPDQYGY